MTNTYQTEIDADDALGLAMRAFVDELHAKGADAETIIYLMASSMFRATLSISRCQATALSIVAKAASDLHSPLVAADRIMVEE